jgi:hypothetical protein
MNSLKSKNESPKYGGTKIIIDWATDYKTMLEHFLEGGRLDLVLHIVAASLSIFLFIISLESYLTTRKSRLAYVCIAFFTFAVSETLVLANIFVLKDVTVTFISHSLNLIVLLAFFAGLVKK